MKDLENNYFAYGLRIGSMVKLPDLPESNSEPNVRIRFGKVDKEQGSAKGFESFENPGVKILASATSMLFDWDRLGKVSVSGGARVVVEPDSDTLEEDLHPFLTGPVLAVLLHQRGFFVLHACAVEINGAVCAFMGAKGFGKSTLAGHLIKRGHRLISDDIVPVFFENSKAVIYPGFPRVKLFEDSIAAIGESPNSFPLVHRFITKRAMRWDKDFQSGQTGLDAAFVLDESPSLLIEKLGAADAFIEISKNTHLNRFLAATGCSERYFDLTKRFVSDVPLFRLSRPFDLEQMNAVADGLEDHVERFSKSDLFKDRGK
ncbi:MAG: hypothetical protein KIS76_10560 [Pyrinomonadaceae bacterium]|nr:hypothetical protein [Pyrinomonadaceae bacterium]